MWVVAANTNTCKIFQYQRKENQLNLLSEFTHPENKLKSGEVISDKPGNHQGAGIAGGTYTQATDPKEVMIENFSREIAKSLEAGRNEQQYEKLMVITPAQMNGFLQKHLSDNVKNMISHCVQKNVMSLNDRDLVDVVRDELRLK